MRGVRGRVHRQRRRVLRHGAENAGQLGRPAELTRDSKLNLLLVFSLPPVVTHVAQAYQMFLLYGTLVLLLAMFLVWMVCALIQATLSPKHASH